jgi:hypothetical protein
MREQIFRSLPLQDRDKFHDWICHVEWEMLELKKMITTRIQKKLNIERSLIWVVCFRRPRLSGWPKKLPFARFVKDFAEYVALEVEFKEGMSACYTWAGE